MRKRYENEKDILISKINDKYQLAITKNKITYSDFLNEKEQMFIKNNLRLKNYFWFGEEENLDRKVLIFYPEKLSEEFVKKSINNIIAVIRITLSQELKRKI